ncbi:MAG: tRNA (guanosine(37)-N1)-methyltransferase TrmD [Bdellovibrionota bacterium]
MHIAILTIFPEIFSSFLSTGLLKKALDNKIFSIDIVNIRDYASPPHFKVDDEPYGGGAGMLMKPEPIFYAIDELKKTLDDPYIVLLTPSGKTFTQSEAIKYSKKENIIFICGRYEGVDQRVIDLVVDEEISIGDYVLMGGEVPCMAVIEATTRLIPNVIGNTESIITESFSENLLEAPQYTRPLEFQGLKVPEVLTSGHHENIKKWREKKAIEKTTKVKPELLNRV